MYKIEDFELTTRAYIGDLPLQRSSKETLEYRADGNDRCSTYDLLCATLGNPNAHASPPASSLVNDKEFETRNKKTSFEHVKVVAHFQFLLLYDHKPLSCPFLPLSGGKIDVLLIDFRPLALSNNLGLFLDLHPTGRAAPVHDVRYMRMEIFIGF